MNQQACPRCGAPRAGATPFCANCGTPYAPEPMAGVDDPTLVAGPDQGWGPPAGQQPASPAAEQWGGPGGPGQPNGPWGQAQGGQAPGPGQGQWGTPPPPQGGQWGPPQGPGGPGGWGPGPQAGGSGGGFNAKIAAIVALVVLLLVGGGVAAAVVLTGDDDDDDKNSSEETSETTGTGEESSGGETSPSENTGANTEEFCSGWNELDQFEDEEGDFAEAKAHFAKLEEIGTPDDIPDDAREGFEIYIDLVKQMDSFDDADQFTDNLTSEQEAAMTAFFQYYGETCMGGMSDLPTASVPTDVPTGIPTDIPTDFSDLPTDFDPSDFGLDEDSLRELESMLSEYATP